MRARELLRPAFLLPALATVADARTHASRSLFQRRSGALASVNPLRLLGLPPTRRVDELDHPVAPTLALDAHLGDSLFREHASVAITRGDRVLGAVRASDYFRARSARDDAAERTAELRLVRAEAARLAHDLNNARLVLHLSEPRLPALEAQLSVIARRLRTLGPHDVQVPRVALAPVLQRFVPVAERLGLGVHCSVHLDPRIAARVPEGALHRVLLNLAANARQAGARSIELRLRDTPTEARIELQDDGPGIREEHRSRIFAPGFSTKGTDGLGLSSSASLVAGWGGRLFVAFTDGSGTTFALTLPRP